MCVHAASLFVLFFRNVIVYLDIIECNSNPCMNDGTCTDKVNRYTCNCRAGYTAANCESRKFVFNMYVTQYENGIVVWEPNASFSLNLALLD